MQNLSGFIQNLYLSSSQFANNPKTQIQKNKNDKWDYTF